MKRLKIGMIGVGDIAQLQINILRKRDDVEIVALADINSDNLAKCADLVPDAACYTDYQDMLDRHKLQAVSVCTPNGLHAPTVIAALKAGAHVMVEKPMAISMAECRKMLATAKQARRKLVVGFQYRYDPRSQFLRQAYDNGEFGRIRYARVQAMRRRGIPNWGVFGNKALQGGGPLIDIGIHMLEACHYCMGAPKPVSASADMFTYLGNKPNETQSRWPDWDYANYTVEDLIVGRIRFADGAVMSIESAFAAHITDRSLMDFQLMGEKGGAKWQEPELYTDEHNHMVDKSPAWLDDTRFNAVFAKKMHAFVEHLL